MAVEPDTGLVAITAKAPTARDSARIANALGRGYVDLRENYDLERIRRTRRRLERLASSVVGGEATLADSQDLLSLTDGIVQLRLAADVQPYSVAIVQPATPPAKAAGVPPRCSAFSERRSASWSGRVDRRT